MVKNFLLGTLMSLNAGYGPLIERHQQQTDSAGLNPPFLSPIALSDEQVQGRYQEQGELEQGEIVRSIPAGLPPETLLARHVHEVKISNSAVAVVQSSDLKMYRVMSVKQSLREDLAEHFFQLAVGQLTGVHSSSDAV